MLKKIFNKVSRAANRKILLSKERRALGPLLATLKEKDIAKAKQLMEDDRFRNRISSADIDPPAVENVLRHMDVGFQGRRILFIPHNFVGHLTHYHHFFGAVVMPLLEWSSVGIVSKGDMLLIRDCGPMNTELLQWSDIIGLKVVPTPLGMIHSLKDSDLLDVWHAPSYDSCYQTDWYARKLVTDGIRKHTFSLLNIEPDTEGNSGNCAKIVVIARGKPDPYYKSKNSETKTSGAQRRSIPNLDELLDELRTISSDVQVAYLENMKVEEKVCLFRKADLVIGQMGAGLNNAIWMSPGTAMIEVLSLDTLRQNFAAYGNICHSMDVRHRRVIQESNHAPVNIRIISGFARDLIASADFD